jgi:hypothetical protein
MRFFTDALILNRGLTQNSKLHGDPGE